MIGESIGPIALLSFVCALTSPSRLWGREGSAPLFVVLSAGDIHLLPGGEESILIEGGKPGYVGEAGESETTSSMDVMP